MTVPWFRIKQPEPKGQRETLSAYRRRLQVSMTGWAIGGQRHRRRVQRVGKHRAGKGIVGY